MSFLDPLLNGLRRVANGTGLVPAEPTVRFLTGLTVVDNPTNGSTDVTASAGVAGTAGQFFVTTVALTTAFVGLSGDIAGSTTVPGQENITAIGSLAGGTIPVGTSTTGVTFQGVASSGSTAPTLAIVGSAALTGHNGGTVSIDSGPQTGQSSVLKIGPSNALSILYGFAGTGFATSTQHAFSGGFALTGATGGTGGVTSFVVDVHTSGGTVSLHGSTFSFTGDNANAIASGGNLTVSTTAGLGTISILAGNGTSPTALTITGTFAISGGQFAGNGSNPGAATSVAGQQGQQSTSSGVQGGTGGATSVVAGAGGQSAGSAANTNGGALTLDGGPAGTGGAGAAGLQGAVNLGVNSNSTTIGQTGKTTTINGNVTLGTGLTLAGDVTGTTAATRVTTITGSANAVTSPGAITWTVAGALALVATAAAVSVDGGTSASFGATSATSVVVGNIANAAGVTVNVKASSVLTVTCGANTVLSVGGAAPGDQLTLGNISGNGQGVYKANSVTVGESAASIVYSQTTHTTDATVHTWTIQAQSAYASASTNTSGAFVILQGGAATSNGVTGMRGGVRLQLGADTAENMLEVKEVAVGQRVTALCGLATVNGTNVPTGDGVCWIGNAQTNPSSNGATGVTVWAQNAELFCTKGFAVQAAATVSFDVNVTTAAQINCAVPLAGNATQSLPLQLAIATQTLGHGGTTTLSAAKYSCPILQLTDSGLTSGATLVLPSTTALYMIDTTGVSFGAQTLTIEGAGGTTKTVSRVAASGTVFWVYVYGSGANCVIPVAT